MFAVTVRDHFMIAHSFKGEAFGPAQRLHGATYIVDVEFRRPDLNAHGVVVDIAAAAGHLKQVLAEFDYRNLDTLPALAGSNTTTEVLAKVIFDRMRRAIAAGQLGPDAAALAALKVTLHESHIASASYEDRL